LVEALKLQDAVYLRDLDDNISISWQLQNSKGKVLDPMKSLSEAGLASGDFIYLRATTGRIYYKHLMAPWHPIRGRLEHHISTSSVSGEKDSWIL
jgi:hypothetical protein